MADGGLTDAHTFTCCSPILAWGAFIAGLAPLAAQPVLRLAADAFDQLQIGLLLGSFTAVLILFSVPITLLGVISPFAIRLAVSDPQKAGSVSGRIYAISTVGSFIGTFLPMLVFIPLVGHYLDLYNFQRLSAAGGDWRSVAGFRLEEGAAVCLDAAGFDPDRGLDGRQPNQNRAPGRSMRPNRLTTTSRCWNRMASECCA